ncbi:MAG: hypothetical protein Q9168_005357 [Polycauliona sp. 1 TL-2023]
MTLNQEMKGTDDKSYLDLAKECDGFPYPDEPIPYKKLTSQLYRFCLKRDLHLEERGKKEEEDLTVGLMLPSVVAAMPWTDCWDVDHERRVVRIINQKRATSLLGGKKEDEEEHENEEEQEEENIETTAIAQQLQAARETDTFAILRHWRPELYRILGISNRNVLIARGGAALFGIPTVGVHMLGFQRTPSTTGEMHLWIARRAASKQTYPNMLNNTVGGAINSGDESPFASLVREAWEEACLPEAFTREMARPVGAISYFYIRDGRAGGEVGLLQPATHYLFDVEFTLAAGGDGEGVPKVAADEEEGEVEGFELWSVGETMAALKQGKFKPNSAVAWIDFLIRHGYVNAGNEPDYVELVSRIHRRIHF